MRTIAVLGATSGIAEACLREWAAPDTTFRLAARDPERLQRVGEDLRVRGGARVVTEVHELTDAVSVDGVVSWLFSAGPVDTVLIAFGDMPAQEAADADLELASRLLHVNGTLTVLAAHLVALRLLEAGQGSLAVIGSVAGDRGRRSNYLYGAAKAMVATAVAGLQHRAAGTDVRITLVKPGPTATRMTDHLQGGRRSLATVDAVASDIVRAVDRGAPLVYTPGRWRLIMTVVRMIPRRVFERTRL